MLASKTFTASDQSRFATLTGDWNPMHMDAVAARRTAAGAPVVHGVHTLLWMLDAIGAQHPDISNVASLRVRFRKMVYLGDQVDAEITRLTADLLQARASVAGMEVVSLTAPRGSVAHMAD